MTKTNPIMDGEFLRLEEEKRYKAQNGLWRKWGPYLSERQWGTVREDYSADGNAWEYLPHDHARSRAYRWGEDGIAGFSDHHQRLCLSLALWNGRDPILKERLFGLTNSEGNHGEDCKELYYYLDATPTHAYLKMLYKYPQREFPYADLVETNRSGEKTSRNMSCWIPGFSTMTAISMSSSNTRRINPTDVNMLVTVHNRGTGNATIHLLPQLWFRNTWSWKPRATNPRSPREIHNPPTSRIPTWANSNSSSRSGRMALHRKRNEQRRLYGQKRRGPFQGRVSRIYRKRRTAAAVNPAQTGTKTAAHTVRDVPAGGSVEVRACLRATIRRKPVRVF